MNDELQLADALHAFYREAIRTGLAEPGETLTDFVLRALIAWRQWPPTDP